MSYEVDQLDRPQLARGVRYRWDEVRSQSQLLYPEGMLVLNESGAAIVKLCDGRSVEDIKLELKKSFPDCELSSDVDQFLVRLAQKGLIRRDNHS